jgi:acetylglutamate kinase
LPQDIILLSALGVKVVLVTGCRPQINERLVAAGRDPISMVEDNGIRRVRWLYIQHTLGLC